MSSIENPELSSSDLHLSDKFPDVFRKQIFELRELEKNSSTIQIYTRENDGKLSRISGVISPSNRRKANFETGKISKKEDMNMEKEDNLNEYFSIPKRGSLPAQKLFLKLKRKKFYKSIDRLSNNHYFMIGDVATMPMYNVSPLLKKRRISLGGNYWEKLNSMIINKLKLEMLKTYLLTLLRIADEKIPTFDTNTRLGIGWDLVVLIFCLTQIFIYSIEKCFGVSLELKKLAQAVIIILWGDLLVKLNTCFYIDGLQIRDRKKIFIQFARNNFLTDIIPCLALTLLFFSENSKNLNDINLLILVKILNALDLGEKINDLLIKGDRSQLIYDLIILILTILMCAHLIACLWHYIGYFSYLNDPFGKNWLKEKGIIDDRWTVRYLFSIYWGVTTMLTVGYGDISPSNETEMCFNIWAMVLGCGMFGYSMNRIGEILNLAGNSQRKKRVRMKKLVKMMKEKEVPPETEIKVKKYLEFVWNQEKREDPEHEKEIFKKLSSKLREEILFNTNVKFLKRVHAFKFLSDKSLLSLANHMTKVRFSPEEIVYREKDLDEISIFFVIDGRLESFWGGEKNNQFKHSLKKIYKKNDYFGVQEVFTGQPRLSGVVSLDFSTAFKLNREDFLSVLSKNREEYEKFCKIRDLDILYNNLSIYNIKCESCGYDDHRIDECRFLKFVPMKLQLISKYINKKNKIRRPYKRKLRIKENALLKKTGYFDYVEEFHHENIDDADFIHMRKYYEKYFSNEEIEESDAKSKDSLLENNEVGEKFNEKASETQRVLSFENLNTIKTMKSKNVTSQNPKIRSCKSFNTFSRDYDNTHSIFIRKKDKLFSPSKNSSIISTKTSHKDIIFDRVKSFKHYFPWNNVENITRKLNCLNKLK